MIKENSDIDTSEFLISINDIKDKYFDGEKLEEDELIAMQNYDKFRLEYLNSSKDEKDFDERYFQLTVMANLHPYTDFLDREELADELSDE
ncbi:MAG: hypothetical protein HUJ25_13100 [Crocinitomicaceae bacterium]|nr:hypothetical protein [Crocinitomicaceae bacterium]